MIADKIWLPTEYEMFGSQSYANTQAEAASDQGRLEYYDGNDRRIKYSRTDGSARVYWEASPRTGYTHYFCRVYTSGAAYTNGSCSVYGVAPAFCVA
jgi:hypothetical protein